MLLAVFVADIGSITFQPFSKDKKLHFFSNPEVSVKAQHLTGTSDRQKEAIVVPHYNRRRFCDTQLPVTTDITETKKLNKVKITFVKRSS